MIQRLQNWTEEDFKTKHYSVGMYGGKFMPMHKGHLYCLDQACRLCDKVYLILFIGGAMEKLWRAFDKRELLSVESRWDQVQRAADLYNGQVETLMIDVSNCATPDGREDWDAETPLVLKACKERFTAVFGSEEILYAPYFERAYPWADYIVVDAERKKVPISATELRVMDKEELKSWII